MTTPKLCPETLRELVAYDPETGKFTWRERTEKHFPDENVRNGFNTRYANQPAFITKCTHGYMRARIFTQFLKAHRVAWAITHGEWPDHIDHINGDRADNRLCNLRSVTKAENAKNLRMNAKNKSGVTGVYWAKVGHWRASIRVNGKTHILKSTSSFEEAVKARKAAEIKFGFHPNHGKLLTSGYLKESEG